jgi:predicted DNA-binding protein
MIRTNIYLAQDQIDRLRTVADAKQTTVAELVRRAIEAYLDAEERRKERQVRGHGNAR